MRKYIDGVNGESSMVKLLQRFVQRRAILSTEVL